MRISNKGFGFVEIILVLAIILFVFYKLFNSYFNKSPVDKETRAVLSTQGIDASNYKTAADSTREKLRSIQAQHAKELEY
jgi:hypothetical protein